MANFANPQSGWVRKITVFNLTETQSATGNPVRSFAPRFTTGCGVTDTVENFEPLASGNAPVDNTIVALPYNRNTLTIAVGDYVQLSGEADKRRVNSVTYTYRKSVTALLTDRMDV